MRAELFPQRMEVIVLTWTRFGISTLVLCLALGGCDSGGDGDGTGGTGTGGAGGTAPISFDADNALPVASASAAAIGVSAELGTLLGAALGVLAEGDMAFADGSSTKQMSIPVACPGGGTITLIFGQVAPEETATLELNGCVGSVLSASALNGTITLLIRTAADTPFGTLPTSGTATVDLATADGNTTITGMFAVNVPTFSLSLPIEFGSELDSDMLRIERVTGEGTETITFVCFLIRMTVALGPTGGTIVDGSFEPTGIAVINGRDVFTLGTREPLSFTGAVATSGSIENTTGNARAEFEPFCTGLGVMGPGNGSIVGVEFSGEECVTVSGTDGDGESFEYGTTWAKLINADTTEDPNACAGPTPGVEGPDSCTATSAMTGTDRLPLADAYVQGDSIPPRFDPNGPFEADTNFGSSPLLLAKSVFNLGFTRKFYMVFDLSDLVGAQLTSAKLVLTLDRHIEGPTRETSGPQPFDFYGVTDEMDWDPDTLAENQINYTNAPKNSTDDDWAVPFVNMGVTLVVNDYDFSVGNDNDGDMFGVDDPGTRYEIDLTGFIQERLDDPNEDGKVTIMVANDNPTTLNVNTSTFRSKEFTASGEDCDRPFLRIEP